MCEHAAAYILWDPHDHGLKFLITPILHLKKPEAQETESHLPKVTAGRGGGAWFSEQRHRALKPEFFSETGTRAPTEGKCLSKESAKIALHRPPPPQPKKGRNFRKEVGASGEVTSVPLAPLLPQESERGHGATGLCLCLLRANTRSREGCWQPRGFSAWGGASWVRPWGPELPEVGR